MWRTLTSALLGFYTGRTYWQQQRTDRKFPALCFVLLSQRSVSPAQNHFVSHFEEQPTQVMEGALSGITAQDNVFTSSHIHHSGIEYQCLD